MNKTESQFSTYQGFMDRSWSSLSTESLEWTGTVHGSLSLFELNHEISFYIRRRVFPNCRQVDGQSVDDGDDRLYRFGFELVGRHIFQ